jgi:beta-mannosidase
MHVWDVWNTDDYTKYGAYRPRFVAEFGFQGPPAYSTLRRAISDQPLAPDSPGMAHHQKAGHGDRNLQRGLDNHLPPPRDFDEWHYLTQLNQARAVAFGITHFRSLRPLCMGSVMWQLNDCWPVTSWAAVDGDGRKKPLWFAMRDAYADRVLVLSPRSGSPLTPGGPPVPVTEGEPFVPTDPPALVAVNDSQSPWSFTAAVTRRNLAGEVLASSSLPVEVAAGDATTVTLPAELCSPADRQTEFLLVEAGEQRTWWFFAPDRDIPWPVADFTTHVSSRGDLTTLTVTARTILRSLTVFPDRLAPAAEPDRADVTLLPGESTVFTIRSDEPLDEKQLVTRPVLRCVNL